MAIRGKVLLVGDSISIGYAPHVGRLLEGNFTVAHHEGNSGDTANLLANLDLWLASDADARLVHFNCGLHDCRIWRKEAERYQVPIDHYRRNLSAIVRHLRRAGPALVWASTTPVITERILRNPVDFYRRNEDVEAYNRVAVEVMAAAGIPTDDLFAVVRGAGPEKCISPDGVHMTEEGYRLLAASVAESAQRHFPG